MDIKYAGVFPVKIGKNIRQIELHESVGKEVVWAGEPHFVPDVIEDTDEINLLVFFDLTYAVIGTSFPAKLEDMLCGNTLADLSIISRGQAAKINEWRRQKKLTAWQNKLEVAKAAIEQLQKAV